MSKFKKAKAESKPQPPQPNKDVETLTAIVNLNQMMIKRVNENLMFMADELQQVKQINTETQYRFLALMEYLNVDKDQLQVAIDAKRLSDFDAESKRMDELEGVTALNSIESRDNLVVLTSTTPDESEDKGIFRSRIRINEMNQPELEASLIGKQVGEVVEAQLNGVRHLITILKVGQLPSKTEETNG